MQPNQLRTEDTPFSEAMEFKQEKETDLMAPVLILPYTREPNEKLSIFKDAACKVRGISTDWLEYLASGGAKTENLYSHSTYTLIPHNTPFVYGEMTYAKRNRGIKVSEHGSVTIHWIEDRSSFNGGWLANVHIELASHASNRYGAQHWVITASLQLNDSGAVIDLVPAVSSGERGDDYGINTEAHCSCETLRKPLLFTP